MPEGMEGKRYYRPTARGVEERITRRLEDLCKRRAELRERAATASRP